MDIKRRNDALRLFDIISELTDEEPIMWGSNIIGYGIVEYYNSKKRNISGLNLDFHQEKTI